MESNRSTLRVIVAAVSAVFVSAAMAADVTKPAAVSGVTVNKSGNDVVLTWSAVTQDVNGAAETVASYRVYRGTAPSFVPDKTGGGNRIGTSATTGFTDT